MSRKCVSSDTTRAWRRWALVRSGTRSRKDMHARITCICNGYIFCQYFHFFGPWILPGTLCCTIIEA